jgi:hopene-associated glycosyltransferase HpnB
VIPSPAWASLPVCVWLVFARGAFWRSRPTLTPAAPARRLSVAVVIPARDEAEHIVPALSSLLTQHFDGALSIILVDDNSSDATSPLAQALARQDTRLHVVFGTPLPPGWSGKLWAVSQGLEHPDAQAADYVLLTDADILHGPTHLACLVAKAEADQCDLVSEMVRLRCDSFAERATIPAFVFFFQMLYPFRWVSDPHHRTAAAAGGTMLLSRAALDRVQGVSRIRSALIDDVALAREVKRGGHRIWLGHAEQAVSERRYPALADVWEMIARTAYVQLDFSLWMLAGTVLGMLLLYAAPVIATVACTGPARWAALAGWILMAAAFQPTLRRYRRSPGWGLFLPAIAAFYLGATVASAMRFYTGKGGRWKNRTYKGAF